MKNEEWVYETYKRSELAKALLQRITQDYEPCIEFMSQDATAPIGRIWAALRVIMPTIETVASICDQEPPVLLEAMGVPEGRAVWEMFRNGLAHYEVPFGLTIGPTKYSWMIVPGSQKHSLIRGNAHVSIHLSLAKLIRDLKECLTKHVGDLTEIKVQVGKKFLQ